MTETHTDDSKIISELLNHNKPYLELVYGHYILNEEYQRKPLERMLNSIKQFSMTLDCLCVMLIGLVDKSFVGLLEIQVNNRLLVGGQILPNSKCLFDGSIDQSCHAPYVSIPIGLKPHSLESTRVYVSFISKSFS